jgi:hypothetical protein
LRPGGVSVVAEMVVGSLPHGFAAAKCWWLQTDAAWKFLKMLMLTNKKTGSRLRATKAGIGRIFQLGIALFALVQAASAPAQEALQNSVAGQTAASQRAEQMQKQDYTFKDGDFRMLVTPSLSAQWNDNVNLSKTNVMDDYIMTPSVGIVSSYPLTERNVLFVDVSIGYSRYFKHPNLSTFNINSSSGTGVSFDIGIKDVTLNLHDWFNYTQDAAQNSTVANTANYGTFQNTAGLAADWDLNQVTLSAGYDHQNVLSTSASYDDINHASEMFFARSAFQVHPQVTVGLETTAALTAYEKNILNNNDAYTVGPYVNFQPGNYFQVTARGGYSIYQFQQTSTIITNQTSSQNSWYAGLSLSHQLRDSLSYSLDAGREVQLGTQSDLSEDYYVRPNINWRIVKGWDFNTDFFYTHGKQGSGSLGTPPPNTVLVKAETYDWYGGELALNHELTSRLTLGFNYRLTFRTSDRPNSGYTQNLVGLQLTYHPK